jgi:hypothetical protein
MAEWECNYCFWKNVSTWTHCAKCGEERISDEDFLLLEKVKNEINPLLPLINQKQISSAPKWEYLILNTGINSDKNWKVYFKGKSFPYNQLNDILDELGSLGWELIGISSSVGSEKHFMTTYTFTYTAGEQFCFKRPRFPIPEDLQKQIEQITDQLPPNLRAKLPIIAR